MPSTVRSDSGKRNHTPAVTAREADGCHGLRDLSGRRQPGGSSRKKRQPGVKAIGTGCERRKLFFVHHDAPWTVFFRPRLATAREERDVRTDCSHRSDCDRRTHAARRDRGAGERGNFFVRQAVVAIDRSLLARRRVNDHDLIPLWPDGPDKLAVENRCRAGDVPAECFYLSGPGDDVHDGIGCLVNTTPGEVERFTRRGIPGNGTQTNVQRHKPDGRRVGARHRRRPFVR